MTNEQKVTLYERLLKWRHKHFSDRGFTLAVAFIVGVFTAFAGIALKWIIGAIKDILTHGFDITHANWLYLVYPVIGIYLTHLFVKHVVKDDISHGITKILFAIARKQSFIKAHNCWSSVCASAITIGFGGSVGAEAPIVLTGSAIGSTLGRMFRVNNRTLMLLVGCGAAGAVSAVFKAPITGLVFVLEVLMIDLTMGSLLPLLVSSITAASIVFAITGTHTEFAFSLQNLFEINRWPAYVSLGITCGLISLYFTRVMMWLEGKFRSCQLYLHKFMMGGAMLSVLIFLFPSLYGEGYGLIELLLNGDGAEYETAMEGSLFYGQGPMMLLVYLTLVVIFKVFATTATNGGGGCGGTFAPSLFLGCVSGFIFGRLWNINGMLGLQVSANNFAMLGMCGLMSGVMHAPLTGIFLIAELTGGYGLFVPLMMVSVCSYLTINIFEPHSIYSMRLARRGELLTHNKDRAVLTLMNVDDVIDKYDELLTPEMDLGQLVLQISKSVRDVFPVVNGQHELLGVIYLDDIRPIMFRSELYHRILVGEIMKHYPARLDESDSMDVIVSVFDRTKAWTLPVVNKEGIFKGFIRRSRVYTIYRTVLADMSEE